MKSIFNRVKLYLKTRLAFAKINLANATYSVLDTETTGLDFKKDKIISIAAIKIKNLQIQEQEVLNELVNPGIEISAASTQIHNITNEQVQGKKNLEEIEPIVSSYLQETILVGHNIDFDINFIKTNVPKSNLVIFVKNVVTIDTILLSAGLYPDLQSYELTSLCNHFNIQSNDQARHSALGDSIITGRLFLFLVEEAKKRNTSTLSDLVKVCKQGQKLHRLMKNAINIH